MKTNLFLFLAIASFLVASPFASGNAFADDKDKDKKHPPITFASFCAEIDDKNSFEALVCTAIADLETQIHNISQTPGPQGPQGPAGPSGANGTNGATGPQGPAGVSAGYSISPAATAVAINSPFTSNALTLPTGNYMLYATLTILDYNPTPSGPLICLLGSSSKISGDQGVAVPAEISSTEPGVATVTLMGPYSSSTTSNVAVNCEWTTGVTLVFNIYTISAIQLNTLG